MINPIPKTKRTRLSGLKLRQLNDYIHWRDNFQCVNCGAYVDMGEKFHHEPCGAYKEDVEEKGCLLCKKCHERRESKDGAAIREKASHYLDRLYPDRRDRFNIPA
jgi:hypothetical protein